ncbi:MAG: tetratricopeptide repeat protein [Lachnospiraceae bacterium]|nr:tetratricopeptide repeat protein [Lachnospiraceae bacterium]
MEKELIFHILGIPETKDEAEIKMAYMRLLKSANPEDDPEGFKRLRQAYEEAVHLAGQPEEKESEEGEEGPKSEIDLWLERVDRLYQNLLIRADPARWEEILSDPVCQELDTALEARERFLAYLMNHIRLPHTVWKLMNERLEILADLEELKQHFPADFLNYVTYYIANETFIPYEYFEYRGLDEESVDGDAYINGYLGVKQRIDRGETEGCLQALNDLEAFELYHPYEDVERIRLYYEQGDEKKASALANRLLEQYPDDNYIVYFAGEAKWRAGEKEQAYELWNRILKENPSHYSAKFGVARYLMEIQDYDQARERMLELLETDNRDEAVEELVRKANDALIQEFSSKLEQGEEDPRLPEGELVMKLGWCLFQNERLKEADKLLAGYEPGPEQEYMYHNLYGRVLYQMDKQEEALPHLQRWLELLRELTDDGTEETRKRMSRHGSACYLLSGCYYSLERQEEAESVLKEGIEAAGSVRERLEYMQYLANILQWTKQYEKSIDVCDQILQESEQYYPAYLTRQEACYHLRKGQQVVDDYYRAINIYPGYYKPYLLAAEVFFFYDQYKDAKGVIERAKENNVEFSLKMKLFEAKILRNLAESREDRDTARKLLEEITKALAKESSREGCDIEDLSEVAYEKGLLWWDDDEFDSSLACLAQAIQENPERLQYRLIRGDVYLEMKRYEEALAEYDAAEPDYGKRPGIHYSKGLCLEELNRKDEAAGQYRKVLELQEGGYRDAFEKLSDYHKDRYVDFGGQEDLEKALYYINQQLAVKENCYYLVCRGLIYDEAMDQEHAIQDYKKALEYSPEKWVVWNNMACSYKYLKQYDKAIECCEKALELLGDRKERLPYRNLADCYKALGQKEKAIECYQKGLEAAPEHAYFWEEIGDLYYDLGRFKEALAAYEHTKSRTNHYKDIGDVWLKQGDLEKCICCYEEGIRLADDSQKAARLSGLGDLYLEELRDFEKAAECYQEAASIEEDRYERFDYKRFLARAYYMMGRFQEAKEQAQSALDDFHESGRNEADYLAFTAYAPARKATFGWLYLCLGDMEKARQFFTEMDQIQKCKSCRFKGCFESFLYLAYLDEFQGDKEQAAEKFQMTLKLNPECREASCGLEFLNAR